jgi:thymidine phosphorylase
MSKKIAEGAKTLVLDVKAENDAFMQKEAEAKKLAQKMINIGIGKKFELNTSAVVKVILKMIYLNFLCILVL